MTGVRELAPILVVDDDEHLRKALRRFLSLRGYPVNTARTAEEALDILAHRSHACMLLDVTLPGMSGIDLVPLALEAHPTLAIIMLSGMNEATSAALCLQRGAFDYLTKPISLDGLAHAVERALHEREKRLRAQEVNVYLSEEIAERVGEIDRERAKLERLAVATLESLASAQEAGDPFLAGHSVRVAEFAASIASKLGRTEEEVERVRLAGRLHDIGKIVIPSRILAKEGPLTPGEIDQVRQHVVVGYQILSPLPHLDEVARFVRHHHERWDGRGYPDGLAGTAIEWGARILAGAEVYDALTTARPYQEPMSPEAAVMRMGELVGTVLEPAVQTALAAVVASRKTLVFIGAQGETPEPDAVPGI